MQHELSCVVLCCVEGDLNFTLCGVLSCWTGGVLCDQVLFCFIS